MISHLLNARFTRRSFLTGAGISGLAAAGSMLAGCGSSSASSASAGSSSTGSSTSGSLTKLSFVLDYTPNTNHTGIYVAQAKGYYADEGLEIDIQQPPEDGADALIGAGSAQLGVSYQDVMANSFGSSDPMPYTAIAAVIQHNTSGIMSRAADNITHPAAMAGHTYATWDQPVEQATIKDVVEADGGDFSQITMVPYSVDDEVSGLKSNLFDTVWVYEGWAVQNAIVQNFAYNYFSFISIDDVFDYYTPVIAANNDFLSSSPDQAKAFLRATKKGYEYAIDNPDDAAQILCDAVPELDSALVKQSQSYLAGQYQADASSWGIIDKSRWQTFYTWLNDNSLVDNQLDASAGFSMDYLEA
ncbi:MAG: ABC transporter substrate-binding protein [Atopobiaceae bacterium]|jgi:ABC-type nitrate/sulfonate/bicarbonate transport system substrate-binding protein